MTKPRVRRHADGRLSLVTDSLTNVVANLGTSRDKASFTTYTAPIIPDAALLDIYRGAWLPRKIVDIPALDSCRAWRDWQAEADQIEKIEAEEMRLGIRGKVMKARTAARLFGGAALLIGTGDADPSKPLTPERIKAGGLRYVTHIHRRQLAPGPIVEDVTSDYFGQPSSWKLNAAIDLHPSRLVFFRGADVPDETLSPVEPGWGDSVLLALMDVVRNLDGAAANIASLIFEAKVDTVGIPDFMNKLGDPQYESIILKRWMLAETGKGINGTLMHDSDELLGQKQASFASLPDLLDRFMQLASGACDIPMTRLMGQSPAGMSSTGESDLRNYYDRISAAQELEMSPAMRLMDECIIRSSLGNRPPDVHYRWASLWQVSARERADIGKVQADTIVALVNSRLVPDEPLAEAAVNMLTESGVMPGLEGAVEDYLSANPDPEEPDDTEAALITPGAGEKKAANQNNDAAPRTLYVRRNVLNGDEILDWARGQGVQSTLSADDLHVTIAFSRTPVDWMKMGEAWEGELTIAAGGARVVDRFGDALVLLFSSSHLGWRHEEMKQEGASWGFSEYQPHITISYDQQSHDYLAMEPYRGEIRLGPEIFEEVKDDWKASVVKQ